MFQLLLAFMIASVQTTLFDFTMKSIDGKEQPLSQYKGKVVIVVNVASFCGYTYQYEMLEALYKSHKDKGLEILAFPSNDFGAQEPGTDSEISDFCKKNYGITFPLFSKIAVKGDDKHSFYKWLTSGGGKDSLAGDVQWNFEKFLIDKNGSIVSRFRRNVEPTSAEFLDAVEQALRQ